MRSRVYAAALGGCFVCAAHAETTNTVDAARIVVTATRSASEMREVPSNPSVITAKDLADGHYTSVPEAIERLAGVQFNRLADNPSQAGVNIRGFGGDNPHGKVLVLLNGRKLNRPDQATVNWAQIPVRNIERIEVVKGANTALYGDHAVGGVIHIITRQPSDQPETTAGLTVGSHGFLDANLVTSGSLDGLGYAGTLGHQSGEGYRDRSRFDTASGSLRLSGALNDSLSGYADLSVVKEQHQLPGPLTRAQLSADRRSAGNPDDAAREIYIHTMAGLEFIPDSDWIFNLDAGASRKDLEADMPSFGPINGFSDNRIYTFSLSPKLTLLTPVAGLENQFLLGADFVHDDLQIDRFNDKSRRVKQGEADVQKESMEFYLHDSLHLLNEKLILSAGARQGLGRIKVKSEAQAYPPWFIPAVSYEDSIRHKEEAYHLGITVLPTETIKLFAKIDRIYRYPFTDEQANYYGWGTDAFNSSLVPEKGISYETGVEFLPMTNLVLQATVFQTDMKDEIAFVGWPVNQNVNLDKTTHRGAELSASLRKESFALDAAYTWLQSEFSDGVNKGNEIPWVPQNRLDINLALFLTPSLTLNTHMSYVGSMVPLGDNGNNSAENQSEYALFDLLAEYVLPIQTCKASVFAGIDNVFGTRYNYLVTDYGFGTGYYTAPERTWKAGLSVTF